MRKLVSARLTVSLSIISALNIASLFVIQWYVILKIGPGYETDALFASFTFPQFFLSVVSSSLTSILVPLFSGESEETFYQQVWGFLIVVSLFFGGLAILLLATVSLWVPLLFPGFAPETLALTAHLSRIQIFTMVFTAIWGVLWAACHSQKRFIYAELSTLIASFIGLALAIPLLPRFGVVSISWITLLRYILQAVLLFPIAKKFVKPDFNNTTFREAWRKIRPLLFGTMFYKTSPIVNRFFVSMTPEGGLSLFYLSQQVYTASLEILNKAIVAPVLPRLSVLAKDEDWKAFRKLYRYYLLITLSLPLIGYFVLIILGEQILHILTVFDTIKVSEVRQFWMLLVALGGLPIAGGLGQLVTSAFYAEGDTLSPTVIGSLGYLIGIGLMTVGFWYYGIIGIAVGTSAYYMFNIFVMLLWLERSIKQNVSRTSEA